MLHRKLEQALRAAVLAVLPDSNSNVLSVRPCPDPSFGDYQTNSLMALAKERKINPRQLAADVLGKLDVRTWCQGVEIAGAGFLNFRLSREAIEFALTAPLRGESLFLEVSETPRTVVVDFSSPNVAKPMHVGHIRSTVLGDSLSRIFRLLGHRVITDNHIGDWGTQFGLLVVGWKDHLDPEALNSDALGEMERLYKRVTVEAEANPEVRERARQELVKLQSGDPPISSIWKKMIQLSQGQFDSIYGRLGVQFDHTLGESFYNPQLKAVVQNLRERGVAEASRGAICVFSDNALPPKDDPFLIQRDGEWQPNPLLIQKADGAANYATTDLATLDYRWRTWQPNEIIYVTDGRQQLHFRQVFATWRRWQPELADRMKLAHVWFGSILGDDGKPFKTRSGETVKLADLLDEAEQRALEAVTRKNPELSEATRREIARIVGIGAIKYADLSPNRQSDYLFSWDKMLSLQGNTAPYLLYAYARIQSIFSKGHWVTPEGSVTISLTHSDELILAKCLLNFGLTLEAVAVDYRPNYLCSYLYELAGHFARFYENCPVLKSEGIERVTRLVLCDLTSRVLKQGLAALGIDVLHQM